MKLKLLLATLLCTSISFSQIPNYVPTNGLVAWYGFNGNANDESSNTNDGTVNGAILTTDRNGNSNSAYSFNGISDYIRITDVLLPGSANSYSFSYWVNPNSAQSALILSDRYGTNCGYKYSSSVLPSNNLGFGMHTASPWIYNSLTSNDIASSSIWTFVVCTYNLTNNTMELWVNGVSQGTTPSSIWYASSNPTTIGAREGCNTPISSFFSGKIDDIGIWNRALSACEIEALYHSGTNPVSAGNDVTICNGESVTLNGSGASLYVWDNTVIDGQSFTPSSTNTYNVTGTSLNSCDYNDDLVVTVNETTVSAIDVTATDTYTSPSGVVYDVSGVYLDTILNANQCDSIITINLTVEYTGINELEKTVVSVYPNPTSEILSISGLEKLNGINGYKIANISGAVIYEIKGQSKQVNISGLRSGFYFLNVIHQEGIETVRFIKQ